MLKQRNLGYGSLFIFVAAVLLSACSGGGSDAGKTYYPGTTLAEISEDAPHHVAQAVMSGVGTLLGYTQYEHVEHLVIPYMTDGEIPDTTPAEEDADFVSMDAESASLTVTGQLTYDFDDPDNGLITQSELTVVFDDTVTASFAIMDEPQTVYNVVLKSGSLILQDEITSTFSAEDATEIRESVSIFSSQDELVVSLGDTEYTVSFTDLSLTVSYDTEDGYTETYAGTVTIDDENYELSELLNESTE